MQFDNKFAKKSIFIFCIIAFCLIKPYAQSAGKVDGLFRIDFTEGFKNVPMQLMDSACRKVIFNDTLNSDKVLGFARSVSLNRGQRCWIIVNNKRYLINTSKGRFAYINFVKGILVINYADKKGFTSKMC